MLRPTHLSLFVVFFAASAAGAQPRGLGIFGTWGAFQDSARCYAIAQPYEVGARGTQPFASVGYWPAGGALGQVHIRLSAEKRAESALLLRIDGRSFQLVGRGWDAWAPDPRADADLLTAMRTGMEMAVETRSTRGGLIRDRYRLRGAPSAIDAAALACARR
jgi:hypothetical protein